MKTKLTLLGGAALLAVAGLGTATTVQAKETYGKGAPEFSDPDGNIKFKVRGRVQFDYVNLDQSDDDGGSTEFNQTRTRRARIGVEGQFDSKFKYKAEVTLNGKESDSGTAGAPGKEVQWEDAYIEYVGGSTWSVILGNQDQGYTLERLTSSRFSTNMERNMGDQAFGFGRTLGIGLMAGQDNWGLSAFVNGDSMNNSDLASGDESMEYRLHGYFTPVNTPTSLAYIGGTVRYRDAQDGASFRYRSRPETNLGSRLVDTGAGYDEDTMYSVEAAGKMGPVYAQGEYTMLTAKGPAGLDDDFSTYFVQAGWFVTGESRNYKGGKFDRLTPNSPVSEGGMGAWELRGRYDFLDLNDNGNNGGEMTAYTLGVNWTPVKNVRFMGEYVNAESKERALGDNYDADVIQFRAQFDW
ncbi:MAG: porin [Caulobacterales bacterium]